MTFSTNNAKDEARKKRLTEAKDALAKTLSGKTSDDNTLVNPGGLSSDKDAIRAQEVVAQRKSQGPALKEAKKKLRVILSGRDDSAKSNERGCSGCKDGDCPYSGGHALRKAKKALADTLSDRQIREEIL